MRLSTLGVDVSRHPSPRREGRIRHEKEATVQGPFQPDLTSKDAITEVIRRGARRLLAIAFEDEVDAFVAQFTDVRDERGRRAVVRNGYLPEQPRVRVRPTHDGIEIPKFTSKLLPPYLRKTGSIEELIPWHGCGRAEQGAE